MRIAGLQQDCQNQFAIILAARLPGRDSKPYEPLYDVFKDVVRARMGCTEPILVRSVPEQEFKTQVLGRIFAYLNAQPTKDVKRDARVVADRLWQQTQGNWHAITRVAILFDQWLQLVAHGPRWVTPEVVNRVLEQLGMLGEWRLS